MDMAPLQSSRSEDGEAKGMRPHAVLQPDKVVASRKGEVLMKYTILKSDHFPGKPARPAALHAAA
jgi:hypothetical protein